MMSNEVLSQLIVQMRLACQSIAASGDLNCILPDNMTIVPQKKIIAHAMILNAPQGAISSRLRNTDTGYRQHICTMYILINFLSKYMSSCD